MSDQNLPICVACGTQYEAQDNGTAHPSNCKICDDPRQFVPPTGQQWTTLEKLKKDHENKWQQDSVNEKLWFVSTEPKFGIGQRATLLQTPHGNVLWDCIALLDDQTQEFIQSKGGLTAIVISHPHFYTTHIEWAKAFHCPVYIAADDQEWLCRSGSYFRRLIEGSTETIVPGVTAVKCGGHFPGSMVLHWEKTLLIADTLMTVPSAYSPHPRPTGQTSYSFMWSIPNMIPLAPADIIKIWRAIEPFEFDTTHAIFVGMDVRDKDLKKRVLESVKIQIRRQGYTEHPFLSDK